MVKAAAGHAHACARHIPRMGAIAFALMLPLGVPMATAADTCGTPDNPAPDSLRYVEYFLSRPQDTPGCAVKVIDGHIVVQAPTSNAAMSCPDMFAWKLFAEGRHRRILEELGGGPGDVAGQRSRERSGSAATALCQG